jgi:predicted ATPase/DNA-binding CsgD family transcriptional regulator
MTQAMQILSGPGFASEASYGRPHGGRLPVPATSMIGREVLVERACASLLNPDVHWLTMTGPPGVGKTRMALRMGEVLSPHFPHGVHFVPLATLAEPDLVLPTVALILDVREGGPGSLLERLLAYLRGKRLLLVLDNLEHLALAAPALASLLEGGAGLKVLATSRTLLRLYGEQDFAVPPLEVPGFAPDPNRHLDTATENALWGRTTHLNDFESVARSEAVRLFVERARAARPDFELTAANAPAVAEICSHLEGLPLAIELAAARVRLLPPQAMLARVVNRLQFLSGTGAANLPPRQQTLRGAVEWSYSLLSAEEQSLFRRLSVFAGGCTLDAAEAVCDIEVGRKAREGTSTPNTQHPTPVLEGIASLVDKSLLRRLDTPEAEPRFAMLATVREYALERLWESDEPEDLHRRHALYYVDMAERAYMPLFGPERSQWATAIQQEYDNLRAAMDWSVADDGVSDRAEIGLRLAAALHPLWEMCGYTSEARNRLWSALETCPTVDVPPHSREPLARVLFAVGRMSLLQRDLDTAEPLLRKSLVLFRGTGDTLGVSWVLAALGHVAIRRGDPDAAMCLYDESFALRMELGEKLWVARSLAAMALVAHYRQDHSRALRLLDRCLDLARRGGYADVSLMALLMISYMQADLGEHAHANAALDEAFALARQTGSTQGIADALAVHGKIAFAQGRYDRAVVVLGAARVLFDSIGLPIEPPSHVDGLEYERYVEEARERVGEDAFARLSAAAQGMSPNEACAFATTSPTASDTRHPTPGTRYPAGLTAREVEVLRLIASGMTNIEAASQLTVSRHTINMHLRSIYSKLEISSRIAATRFAIAQRLV